MQSKNELTILNFDDHWLKLHITPIFLKTKHSVHSIKVAVDTSTANEASWSKRLFQLSNYLTDCNCLVKFLLDREHGSNPRKCPKCQSALKIWQKLLNKSVFVLYCC